MRYQASVTSIEESILRPVLLQCMYNIKPTIHIPQHVPMLYDDGKGVTEIGSEINKDNNLLLKSDSKVITTSSSVYYEDRILGTHIDTHSVQPVWYDDKLGIRLTPTIVRNDVTFNMTYKAKGRQEVMGWLSNHYNRMSRGSIVLNMDVGYEYPLPTTMLSLLYTIWETREKIAGYGDTFKEYLEGNFKQPYNYKTNMAGDGLTLVLTNTLKNVVGVFGGEVEEPEMMDDGYGATIKFTFWHDIPTTILAEYPIYIHNNYIDQTFINMDIDRNKVYKTAFKRDDELIYNLNTRMDNINKLIVHKRAFVVPSFDYYEYNKGGYNIQGLIQLQISISEDDPRLILDLNEIDEVLGEEYEVNSDLITYMGKCGDQIYSYKRSAVFVLINEKNKVLTNEPYYIDTNLHLRSKYDLKPRHNYHLTISLLGDLHFLVKDDLYQLSVFGELSHAIILRLDPGFNRDYLPAIREDGSVSVNSLKIAIGLMATTNAPGGLHHNRFVNQIRQNTYFR
jgi:hypothetical protein